jgi:hypothetical protein
MRVAWLFSTVALFVAVIAFMACVGSDPVGASSGGAPATGEHLGPCYPNGTCNAGLECRDTVCLTPGEPAPDGGGGGGDASNDTSSVDAAQDTGPDGCVESLSMGGSDFPCGATKCFSGEHCCGDGGTASCFTSTGQCAAAGSMQVECMNPLHCAALGPCCSNLVITDPNSCPISGLVDKSTCTAGASCTNGPQLCDKASPNCMTGKCTPVSIKIPGTASAVLTGACL